MEDDRLFFALQHLRGMAGSLEGCIDYGINGTDLDDEDERVRVIEDVAKDAIVSGEDVVAAIEALKGAVQAAGL
jgi:hypothetical protein